jgi:hypothetical protein
MKKYLLSLLAVVFGIGVVQARPVSESQAKYVGQQFVQANFEQSRQSGELTLVYTGTSTRGEACFYVFNVGNEGFVMVSADDAYRPIVGFSDEGIFDAQNINRELAYMLGRLIDGRTGRNLGEPTPMVAAEWELLSTRGTLMSFNGGRANTYLCQTKWNQDYPYNYYCPTGNGGPGGHVYAGCVASAMSQLMKFWNYPTKGQGSHSYYYSGGPWTANFGDTNYDWDNMPNALSSNSPQVQIDAVATLMYHCGVSVDMMWSVNGSGAYSADVPGAISQYFLYTNQATLQYRDSYTYQNWANKLKESFDMGWPLYYAGQSPDGGHAFVCDGYNDANLYHYNWGWGGSGDGWFDFDNIDYNSSDGAVFNFVPSSVYDNTPQPPTSFTVTPAPNNELSAQISWVNPTKTLTNVTMPTIDQVVVTRNGEVIYTESNVTPGGSMSITDNSVPRFDAFNYAVYAIYNGMHGKMTYQNAVSFGPTCGWTVQITQAAMNGFRGGIIHIYNASGTEIAQVTTTNSGVQAIPVDIPLGGVSFGWTAQTYGDPFNMGFSIKDSQNNTVFTFSGSSADLEEGIFFHGNNSCGNSIGDGIPSNAIALVDEENPFNINVSWDGISDANGYGYTVYRDGLFHRLIVEGTSFVDENAPMGGHCYIIGYLYDGGENGFYSNESCATAGTCYAPTNIDYEYTGNAYKIKLKWERPEPSEGLSGYYLFRKFGEDEEYQRIKSISASATTYTDNTATQEGDYYYKLYAYYAESDCTSAPANWKYDSNQFYIRVLYSSDAVNELEASSVSIFPNPTTSQFTVEAEGLSRVTVFNTMGQKVYEMNCQGESVDINLNNVETGVYMVRIATVNGETTKRITVIR